MRNLIFLTALFFAPLMAQAGVNFGDHLQVLDLVPIASLSSTTTSTSLDLQQYSGQVAVIFSAHKVSGTNPTLDVKLQDSADNSSFADVSGAVFAQVTTTDTSSKLVLNKDSLRRYVQIVSTLGGTTPVYLVSVKGCAVKKNPQ